LKEPRRRCAPHARRTRAARYKDSYRLHVEAELGRLCLGAIEPRHTAAVVGDMRARGYAESTINSVVIVLRGIFRIELRRGLISRSPVDGLDPAELSHPVVDPNHGRRLDERELAALVRHATDPYREVVAVLAYTGLRLSEALGLRWRDVDFVECEFHVRGQLSMARRGRPARIVQAKSAASVRVVPLMPAVERALTEQLEREQSAGRGREGDFVFVTRPRDADAPAERGSTRRRGGGEGRGTRKGYPEGSSRIALLALGAPRRRSGRGGADYGALALCLDEALRAVVREAAARQGARAAA
jgi:integrase